DCQDAARRHDARSGDRVDARPSMDHGGVHRGCRGDCVKQLLRVSDAVARRLVDSRGGDGHVFCDEEIVCGAMKFPDLEYITWAKSLPLVAINLARSGIDHCPASLLRLKASDLV